LLLTVDIGTSNFKSALWDADGNCVSSDSIPLSIKTTNCGKYEFECAGWLKAFETSCRKLGNLSGVDIIVITGNGPTLVPVTGEPRISADGLSVPAENALLWLDRRAVKYQDEVSGVMGGFVDASFFLPKVLSIRNDNFELYRSVKCFLGCPEYLAYALTGEARTVFPSEGFDRWFWNNSALERLELDTDKFPSFIHSGDQFGTVVPSVAGYLGFAKNIPVVSGGPDFFAAILGAGVTEPETACDRTGSSEGINLCTQNRVTDKRLMSFGHPVKPYWNLSGIINTTGKAVQWCINLLRFSGFADFFATAKKSAPGSGGMVFLPYLAGERSPVWDSKVRGIWRGINLNSAQSEAANSVLEGICYAIKDVVSVMEENGGYIKHLRVTGGMAANGYFNQLKADICGKEIVELKHKEAELLGLAAIGSCFLGKYKSFAEAACSMVKIERRYEPDSRNENIYSRLYSEYIESRNFLVNG
jgi:xylulokinase